jgi:hypothetical protein
MMSKGGYNGGSTMIGPRTLSWFSTKKKNALGLGKKGISAKTKAEANNAAIIRHEEQVEIERYRLLADALRAHGFTEQEVQRGLQIQEDKDRNRAPNAVKSQTAGTPKKQDVP